MNIIHGINGPIITATSSGLAVAEVVKIGERMLEGEVISLLHGIATIQTFESTAGLSPGMPIVGSGQRLSVTMRPGVVGQIFDGIMRPLDSDMDDLWPAHITVTVGQHLSGGDIYAEVSETPLITFRAMVPPGVSGTVTHVATGTEAFACNDTIVILDGDTHLTLSHKWPIRTPRPIKHRQALTQPLVTGQRVIDTFFPIAKGGTAMLPGGFGTGKTITQHQLAKWCDADLIVYIGCGERGNEMTDVLESFARLKDPKRNRPLLERTILIANTSDMPVAAREASIFTGITIAECYRDMGYHVAIMADSTSRWAEALRELSSRLGEMPAEEGYPAYLASRLSAFYGRAGYVTNLNGTEGSVTIIGAVSPQGGDFTEPVTQYTRRFVQCYLALDKRLAYAHHFPAINWIDSYSSYPPAYKGCEELREKAMAILLEEHELLEVVKILGTDGLTERQQNVLMLAKAIRQGFLQQNAYDPKDAYTPPYEQFLMLGSIMG